MNIGSGYHQTNTDERTSEKGVSQENKKTSQNQMQSSNQKNKYIGCYSCKQLWTLLKLNKGGSLANKPQNN